MKVLIVDDEKDILEIAKRFLEKEKGSLQVETASSGVEALELIEKNHYDAIVSDYRMPKMDGLELLRKIRESGNNTLYYILTGRGDRKASNKALKLGATGYFNKTHDPRKVFENLHKILVNSIRKRQNTSEHLIAWITVGKNRERNEDGRFENALKLLGEIIDFKISEIRKQEVPPEKEVFKAYTSHYSNIPKSKEKIAEKWRSIVTEEPEVIEAEYKPQKIQQYKSQ